MSENNQSTLSTSSSDEWIDIASNKTALPPVKPNDEFEVKHQIDVPSDKLKKLFKLQCNIEFYITLETLSPEDFTELCNNKWFFELCFENAKFNIVDYVLKKFIEDNVKITIYKKILNLAIEYNQQNIVNAVINNVDKVSLECLINAIDNLMSKDIIICLISKYDDPNKLDVCIHLLKNNYCDEFEKLCTKECVMHSIKLFKLIVEKNLSNSIEKYCDTKYSIQTDEECQILFNIVNTMIINGHKSCVNFIKANYDKVTIQYQNANKRTIFSNAIVFNKYDILEYHFENFLDSLFINKSSDELFRNIVSKKKISTISLFLKYTTPKQLNKKLFSKDLEKLIDDINTIIKIKEIKFNNGELNEINKESIKKMINVLSRNEKKSPHEILQNMFEKHHIRLVMDNNRYWYLGQVLNEKNECCTVKFVGFDSEWNEMVKKGCDKIKPVTCENLQKCSNRVFRYKIYFKNKLCRIESVDVETKKLRLNNGMKIDWTSPDLKYWE